jgi:hypothetical protein
MEVLIKWKLHINSYNLSELIRLENKTWADKLKIHNCLI